MRQELEDYRPVIPKGIGGESQTMRERYFKRDIQGLLRIDRKGWLHEVSASDDGANKFRLDSPPGSIHANFELPSV